MCFMMSCNLVSVHSYISWCGLMNSLYFEVIEDFDHLWENYQIGLKKGEKKKIIFPVGNRITAIHSCSEAQGNKDKHQFPRE